MLKDWSVMPVPSEGLMKIKTVSLKPSKPAQF
jgi:hypothetical protein